MMCLVPRHPLRHGRPAMKQVTRVRAAVLAAAVALGAGVLAPSAAADEADDYHVLIVGKTLGFRHSHIPHTTNAIIELGEQHGFEVDVWDPQQRSEEHTSELQSRENLVCRLLLEKKKDTQTLLT